MFRRTLDNARRRDGIFKIGGRQLFLFVSINSAVFIVSEFTTVSPFRLPLNLFHNPLDYFRREDIQAGRSRVR